MPKLVPYDELNEYEQDLIDTVKRLANRLRTNIDKSLSENYEHLEPADFIEYFERYQPTLEEWMTGLKDERGVPLSASLPLVLMATSYDEDGLTSSMDEAAGLYVGLIESYEEEFQETVNTYLDMAKSDLAEFVNWSEDGF